jgi:phage host-nuclease inhibitor protein Gam
MQFQSDTKRLQCDCNEIMTRLKSDHEAITMQLQSDTKRLQCDYKAIAKGLQSDCQAMTMRLQSYCEANAMRLQSNSKAIAKLLQSDYNAIAKRLQSDCNEITKRVQTDHEAIEMQSQCNCKTIAYCKAIKKPRHRAGSNCLAFKFHALTLSLPPSSFTTKWLTLVTPSSVISSFSNTANDASGNGIASPECIKCELKLGLRCVVLLFRNHHKREHCE